MQKAKEKKIKPFKIDGVIQYYEYDLEIDDVGNLTMEFSEDMDTEFTKPFINDSIIKIYIDS